MITIKLHEPKIKTEEEYWEWCSKQIKVIPLKKRCGDCAISTGFYITYAENLIKQPKLIQENVADAWTCHNACNRGCAGLREFLKEHTNEP